MTTECFNLVEKPWLPVALAAGFPNRPERGPLPRVSLREAFEHGDKIVDLRCRPHERIALMRLLICIAQRALEGPANEEDWMECRTRLAEKVRCYLTEQRGCFSLLGDSPRFLQKKTNRRPTQFSTQKLLFIDEEGTTLFDGHVQPGYRLNLPDLAVALITFQSFAAGGRVEGASDALPGGLCRENSALHSFLIGTNLIETVWLNLVPKDRVEDNGTMVFGDTSWHTEKQGDKAYLYRLAPIARYLWLSDDGATVEGCGGRNFLTFEREKVRELTTAIRSMRNTSRREIPESEELVSASAGGGIPKGVWRELHALTVLRSANKRGGPVALQHCQTLQDARQARSLRLWCGALVGGGKNRAAATGDTIESVFLLPIQMLENADSATLEDVRVCPSTNRTYRQGVSLAEQCATKLQMALKRYFESYDPRDPKKKRPDRDNSMKKMRQQKANAAATRFWTALEQRAEAVLLHDVAVNSGKYWNADKPGWLVSSPWGREVMRAAEDAFAFACPHSTPRQLRAYADGLTVLRREDKERSKTPEEGDEAKNSTET